jgi:uracil-DNA glycosylase
MDPVEALHQRILACRRCEDAGFIQRAAPVVAGRAENRMMLVGQAPGATEVEFRRPFQGRAGRQLFRWMASIGIDEDAFRSHVYMTAITKCFPGKSSSGNGDRRPSREEIALCNPWLMEQLSLLDPDAIILVGGLAIKRFFSRAPLAELIGTCAERDGVRLIPLPHPSGSSRWLNAPGHRVLLQRALTHVRAEWDKLFATQASDMLKNRST